MRQSSFLSLILEKILWDSFGGEVGVGGEGLEREDVTIDSDILRTGISSIYVAIVEDR